MISLHVNNFVVGNYSPSNKKWDINLHQEVQLNCNIVIYQYVYYLREFGNFFTLYVYEDSEKMVSDLYLIDSIDIDKQIQKNENIQSYSGVKVCGDMEWKDLVIGFITKEKN